MSIPAGLAIALPLALLIVGCWAALFQSASKHRRLPFIGTFLLLLVAAAPIGHVFGWSLAFAYNPAVDGLFALLSYLALIKVAYTKGARNQHATHWKYTATLMLAAPLVPVVLAPFLKNVAFLLVLAICSLFTGGTVQTGTMDFFTHYAVRRNQGFSSARYTCTVYEGLPYVPVLYHRRSSGPLSGFEPGDRLIWTKHGAGIDAVWTLQQLQSHPPQETNQRARRDGHGF